MRTRAVTALRRGLVSLVMAVLVGPAAVQATTLRWKFRPGETLHYVMEQKTETKAKAAGQEIKTTLTQTIHMNWAVKGVGPDGVAALVQTINRVQTKIDSAFGAFEFDSDNPKEPEGPIAAQIVPLLKALVGAQFSFKMNPQGELSDVQVPERVAQALRAAGPAGGGGAGGGMFSEEGLKNMISESSLTLPKQDLARGTSWTRQTKLPSPPLGTMVMDKTYRYQGADPQAGANLERIDLETKIDLQPMPESKITFQIKSQNGKGSFFFDNAAGRVARSQVSEAIEYAVTVMDTELIQDTDTTTSMRLEPGIPSGSPR